MSGQTKTMLAFSFVYTSEYCVYCYWKFSGNTIFDFVSYLLLILYYMCSIQQPPTDTVRSCGEATIEKNCSNPFRRTIRVDINLIDVFWFHYFWLYKNMVYCFYGKCLRLFSLLKNLSTSSWDDAMIHALKFE